MSIQDWQNTWRGVILGGERVCAYRNRAILCCESDKQEADGRERAYGSERNCRPQEGVNGASEHLDVGGLL
jgi:hypothetical protein